MKELLLVLWLIIIFATSLIETYYMPRYDGGYLLLFPSVIYTYTKLNKFGAWFVFILLAIVNPLMFIVKISYLLVRLLIAGIKYIFTVGR